MVGIEIYANHKAFLHNLIVHLIHINASYKPAYIYGGPTMSVAKLCETISAQNIDIEVLTTLANGKKELDIKSGSSTSLEGVKVTYYKRLTKDHSHFSPNLLIAFWKKIRLNKDTIVHIHAWWNLVSILTCLIAKCLNIPVVLSPRGMLTNYTQNNRNSTIKSIFHKLIGKKLIEYCSVHATSEKEKYDILEIANPKSVHVISNIVELPKNIEPGKAEAVGENFNLLFLSRIEKKKGLEYLFEALSKLTQSWNLTIAGFGEEEYVGELKKLSKTLNIDNKVNWIGQVPNSSKFDIIAKHDLLVLTSNNENFANVIVESLYMGTPVLVSKHVGLADYVEKKNLGWICELESENIKTQIVTAFDSRSHRKTIRTTAQKIIKEDFNPKNLFLQYQQLYSHVLMSIQAKK